MVFRVRGGVKLRYNKELTSGQAVVAMPTPRRLYLPLQQHIGAPAIPVVTIGDQVLKGQLVAKAAPGLSAPVHASSSGTVVAIEDHVAPHPSGLQQRTIVIETDGLDRWIDLPPPVTDDFPLQVTPREINSRVAAAGIVGMGGAAFPSAVKLDLKGRHQLDTLLINGAECEPYLTCDDRLMREEAWAVIDGVRIMAYALEVQSVIFAIERNKPEALAAIRGAARREPWIQVMALPTRFPMGSERHLVLACTGRETPARKLTADIGVVVHNVATARAVARTVRSGEPLISRVVTVSGRGVREPSNVKVPLGTLVEDLLAFCGGLHPVPYKLIGGGPMMGAPLPSVRVPVVKGTSGVLALTIKEQNDGPESPCIRCASCVSACPCGLVPVEMAQLVRRGDLQGALAIGLQDCVSCGSCSFICPSHIPLAHYFNFAKGQLGALDRDARRQERIRSLVQARSERTAREAGLKKVAAAARKAAKAAAQAPAPAPTSTLALAGGTETSARATEEST
ncbi:electron transport complex subunit RsxC [Rhodoferax antarcticus]|uniref:electron transport complex subunit RsxC n=1 Tax=Rhodoferax antarcticus TaxID=81479 RepID=UPI00222471A6|nr:electron transport complex subunit RsxC [Rhodoferax antarcticus]MCW2312707.1 electron transport complex protein RnfC [Rhodoferax antarcticus]